MTPQQFIAEAEAVAHTAAYESLLTAHAENARTMVDLVDACLRVYESDAAVERALLALTAARIARQQLHAALLLVEALSPP